jgi:hypothetical protein
MTGWGEATSRIVEITGLDCDLSKLLMVKLLKLFWKVINELRNLYSNDGGVGAIDELAAA